MSAKRTALFAGSLLVLSLGAAKIALSERAAADTAGPADLSADAASIENSVFDVASGDARFTTLVELIQLAGLETGLDAPGAVTVFAPTNDAFAALPAETLTALKEEANRPLLVDILKRHVAPQPVTSAAVTGLETQIVTVGGDAIDVDATDGVKIGEATVVEADIQAANGFVHAIDAVLLPAAVGTIE